MIMTTDSRLPYKQSAQVDLVSMGSHIAGLQYVIARLGGLEKISLQTLSVLYW
jgi:hypothetical protein